MYSGLPNSLQRAQNQIARHKDAYGRSGSHTQCRLNAERTVNDPLARSRDAVPKALAQGPFKIAALAVAGFGTDREQRRKPCCGEHPSPVIVGLAREACRAGSVRSRLRDLQGCTVRENDPVPDDERALLSERDLGLVATDEPRALRYEQMAACPGVVDPSPSGASYVDRYRNDRLDPTTDRKAITLAAGVLAVWSRGLRRYLSPDAECFR